MSRRPLTSARLIQIIGSQKGLVIPREGWTAGSFVQNGSALIETLSNVATISQAEARPEVAVAAGGAIEDQTSAVVSALLLTLLSVAPVAVWLSAIDNAIAAHSAEAQIVPVLQSVMAQGYARTARLVNPAGRQAMDPAAVIKLAREASRNLAKIDETTRKQVERVVTASTQAGDTVQETARKLADYLAKSTTHRANTIARTEINRMWTLGAAEAYSDTQGLLEVSIVGCQAREPHSPHYRGQSTCNFIGLPVAELPAFLAVGFHPNHTGTLVPTRFKSR